MTPNAAPTEALLVFGDEHWRRMTERAHALGAEWAPEMEALLPSLAQLESYVLAAREDPTPLLLSHRDADPKNTMRTPSGELILIDWDAAAPVNPRQDLANCALVWAAVHAHEPDVDAARTYVDAYRRAGGIDEPFRPTDLAELVALRLSWLNFNLRRALGERIRDESDRDAGVRVIRRQVEQLPRFVRSLEAWVAVLGD
jgi:aminoglycoside phosphotransferase (APT) family kinase protein